MLVHILGWSTVASEVGLAVWLGFRIRKVGRWRPFHVRAPKLVKGVNYSRSGHDYVGVV